MTKVFIPTYCTSLDHLYGNLLTFKTIRVGFPNAELIVMDNQSKLSGEIEQAAKSVGAKFITLPEQRTHYDFINDLILGQWEPFVVCDADMVFWDNLEDYQPTNLVAGRYIPRFYDDIITKRVTEPRVHTSLLYFTDPLALRRHITQLRGNSWWFGPCTPTTLRVDGIWRFWDDLASLFAADPTIFEHFPREILNRYDHINFGSYTKPTDPHYPHHVMAQQDDLSPLKGIWREQERYYLKQNKVANELLAFSRQSV